MTADKEGEVLGGSVGPSAILPTTDHTWTALELNSASPVRRRRP